MHIRQYREALTQPVTPSDIVEKSDLEFYPRLLVAIWTGVDLLAERFICWLARRRTRAVFDAMPPRLRADIGVDAGNVHHAISVAVHESSQRRVEARRLARARTMAFRRTRRELMALDDRELQDIGIGRGDIDRIARGAQLDVAEGVVANPQTATVTIPGAANEEGSAAAAA